MKRKPSPPPTPSMLRLHKLNSLQLSVYRSFQHLSGKSTLQLSLGMAMAVLPAFPLLAVTPDNPESDSALSIQTIVESLPAMQVTVTSNADGPIAADGDLTLREAIHIVNGTLPVDWLSEAEQGQVATLGTDAGSQIAFDLPANQTTIYLQTVLPPLAQPGLTVDGTTQPGYQAPADLAVTAPPTPPDEEAPPPVVALTPAPGQEVFRGLTVVADNVAIRGLSLYGFTARHRRTVSMPPGDIFIAHHLLPDQRRGVEPFVSPYPTPPKGVEIEDNWLGIPPTGLTSSLPVPVYENSGDSEADGNEEESASGPLRSAFGVYVFNSLGTTIRRNRIANHDGSAIITAKNAENLLVTENLLEWNGLGGMPDAIRLEGNIRNTRIFSNSIRENAGSSIYMFKPVGAALIQDNEIVRNGQRYRRAAIYLMGNDHQVLYNQVEEQPGPGVAVTGYPSSDRNLILGNRFSRLDGLSIDLVTEQDTNVLSYQTADGANPIANSFQRKRKTANFGIGSPRFVSREFFLNPFTGKVTLIGKARPQSQLEFYQVNEGGSTHGPLSQPIATLDVDSSGKFTISFDNLKPGDKISATATHPEYGTSEPARNAVVRSIPSGIVDRLPNSIQIPVDSIR